MGRFLVLFLISSMLAVSSCKERHGANATDNLFKYKDYISYHTNGIQSIASPIKIILAKPLGHMELAQELPNEYIAIAPKVNGKLSIEKGRELIFRPTEYLIPNTEYSVTLALGKLFEHIDGRYKKYTFSYKTIAPDFKITLGDLQSYSKDWQYLTGILEASDLLDPEKLNTLLSVRHQGEKVGVTWNNVSENARFFNFRIDSIRRRTEDAKLAIHWNGASIGAENKGMERYTIPGLNKFVVVGAKTSASPNPVLTLNFSEPLQENQNLNGLVTMENAGNLRFETDGNVLRIYPSRRVEGQVLVKVFEGVKNAYGLPLKKVFSDRVSFERLKPNIRLISKGAILPNAAATPIYFETVSLNAVEVRVIQVFEDNMLQYLQNRNMAPRQNSDLRAVGRRVAHKIIPLTKNEGLDNGYWKAHALDLSTLIKVNPGSLYRIEFSFKKEHISYTCNDNAIGEDTNIADTTTRIDQAEQLLEEQYWDKEIYYWRKFNHNWEQKDNPCNSAYYGPDKIRTTNLLGSDLGLIVKKGTNNSYHFAATNLLTAEPEGSTTIKLYNYQQQILGEVTTDASGFAIYDGNKTVAFAVAEKDKNFAYAKLLDGNALSLSKFDVSGQELQKGLQGYIYTDRGVHRPGDTVHLTFVLNDNGNPLPEKHPITLEVTDAKGKLVQRTVLKNGAVKVSDGHYAKKENNFYYFPIPTKATAPTGTWNAKVVVGGAQYNKGLKIATVKPNRLKVNLTFDEEVLRANAKAQGKIEVQWLHGAPARNLKIDVNATLKPMKLAFKGYTDYVFNDPVRRYDQTELQFFNAKLNENGVANIDKKMNINAKVPGMLRATFITKAFEGGGDYSVDVFSKKVAPFSHFVGLRSPKPKRYGSFPTDENIAFDVVSVTVDGRPSAKRKLKVKVFKIEWRWWWNRGYDNLSRYENTTVHRPFKEVLVTTGTDGKANFSLNIPDDEGGRFLIRIMDEASGHATGRTAYFYKNWWKRPATGDSESSKILMFSSDKESYKPGENAVITFPSDKGGRALLSIENGTEVLSFQWMETSAKETTAIVPITAEMAPNAYVNISLLQPHGQVANDLPIRLYGVVPILVEDPATRLEPKLLAPDVLEPEKTFKVSVSEANGKPMTYSLAIVDDGLLDLTRFKTPDIHSSFYARQALGVKTFDIFDDVMGAHSINVDNIYAIGGGDIAESAKNRRAQRFKPVTIYLGPFGLAAEKKAVHEIKLPNYIGSVRTMLIAGNENNAYGNAEKTIPVRKPLMVLTTIPRKLSPGETVTIPVTVFAMHSKVRHVKVDIWAGRALEAIGPTSKNITFNTVGEKMVDFDFKVHPAKSFQTIKVMVSGAGESALSETEIDVENPNPITTKSTVYTINKKQSKTIDFTTFGTLGSNSAFVELSTLPPLDFSKRMEFLVRYPHGCAEQITSAAFPQLFLADVVDITSGKKREIGENIKRAIKKLGDLQVPNGGLGYWPGNDRANDWASSYAGHFLLEAKQKGYQLPLTFLSNWLRFQKNSAKQWSNKTSTYNDDFPQAYRLYTLALAQQPELAAMNRLRESRDLGNEAKWRLAAAYALVGQKEVAQQLANTANIDFKPNDHDHRTYGSVLRNRAMALETMLILGAAQDKQRDLAVSLAKNLSSQRWYSTQETSYALLAMAKMVGKNGGRPIDVSLTGNGQQTMVKTDRAIAQRPIAIASKNGRLVIKNNQNNIIYATLTQSGRLPIGQELASQRKLNLSVNYLDASGNRIAISELRQGTELQAKVTVFNSTDDEIGNMALSHIVPSGWEIVNAPYFEGFDSDKADYVDIRDDRTNFYFGLGAKQHKTFVIKLNASFLGRYYLPGAQAEAMYDNTNYARSNGQWVEVVR